MLHVYTVLRMSLKKKIHCKMYKSKKREKNFLNLVRLVGQMLLRDMLH